VSVTRYWLPTAVFIALTGCGGGADREQPAGTAPGAAAPAERSAADVDGARILGADSEPGNWLTAGRTYSEQNYSPLDAIDADNVATLGLAWYRDLDTQRGQESTPLVIDGVMYVTTAWSKVLALDARTGEELWKFDPEVPGGWAVNVCCDVVNRGAAAWQGKIYVGTLDGRLIALDAATGEPVWSVQTFDKSKPYAISGAPRIANGLVMIGNAGSEYDTRGYVTAYDAETGSQVWRFYAVPGNPADGFENDAMRMAAETWNGEWWKLGGGGSPWNAIVYDPETDLVYIGTGNGVPWNRALRSPGGGDNLFLSSIVAVKAETGEYVWHYQTTPGDEWDYDSTEPIMTADLVIDGETRHVVMQAPKNGFFYVLDAATGELISAEAFAPTTWATGIDLASGRPIEAPGARYSETGELSVVEPSPNGAHNWQPWSYNPGTGLVYIPEQEGGFPFQADEDFTPVVKGTNLGLDMRTAEPPVDAEGIAAATAGSKGALLAWDPIAQTERWRVQHAGPWNGGTLTTAGNLLVQGLATGKVEIYRADTGETLWSFDAQTGVLAGPMSYTVDDEQYIAVAAGWGGSYALLPGGLAKTHGAATRNISRILVFKRGGTATLPAPPPVPEMTLDPPPMPTDAASIDRGELLFERHCAACHGGSATSGGMVPDLRYSANLVGDGWDTIVLDGALEHQGMATFGDIFDRDDAEDIRNYVIMRARQTLEAQQAATEQ
jgi:quinohemoprotein ethanol dehydrogenase